MRAGWEIRALDEVADQSLGKMLDKSKNRGTLRPYLRNLNVRWFDFDLTDVQEMRFEDHELDRYSARKGDLVICEGGYPGRAAIWRNEEPIFLQKALHRVRFKEPERASWLLYYLMLCEADGSLKSHFTGTGIQHLTGQSLRRLRFPLPPIAEQKCIVALLDEAFDGIDTAVANAEGNLANARELFDGYLNSVFTRKGKGWVERKLSDICGIESKLVDPREAPFIDLPHLGAGNIISKTGEIVEVKTAREENLISGKFLFNENTVLYSKIRPYLMKACRPRFSGLCSADVYPLIGDSTQMNRDFLFHMLMSRQFTDYAVSGSDRSGMPKVNRDHLFQYGVWLPPVEEQARLAAKLDMISAEAMRLETIYEQKLTSLGELKKAILQKAFAGELTARSIDAVQEAAE